MQVAPIPLKAPPGRNFSAYLIIAIAATLLMSPFGWQKFLFIGGNYYPEVAFVALLIITASSTVTRPAFFRTVNDPSFLIITSIFLILFGLGVALLGNLLSAYADLRCLMAICFTAFLFKNSTRDETFYRNLVLLLVSCLAMNVVGNIMLPKDMTTVKYSFPVYAMIFSVYLCGRKGWYGLMGVTLALGTYLTIVSFFRQNYVILVLSFCIAAMSLLAPNRSSPRRQIMALIFVLFGAAVALRFAPLIDAVLSTYLRGNESRYIQSIGKTRDLIAMFSGGTGGSSELSRLRYFSFISENLPEFLLPSGLGQKVILSNWRTAYMPASNAMIGSSLDGGHLFMAVHFGLVLSLASTLLVLRKWVKMLANTSLRGAPSFLLTSLTTLFGFAGSSPFSQMGLAISFGVALGLLLFDEAPVNLVQVRPRSVRPPWEGAPR